MQTLGKPALSKGRAIEYVYEKHKLYSTLKNLRSRKRLKISKAHSLRRSLPAAQKYDFIS